MSVRVKICGLTRVEDAQAAVAAGAEALGFNFVPGGPRYLADLERARELSGAAGQALRVGVFADADVTAIERAVQAARLNVVQLHGGETPAFGARLRQALPNGVQLWKVYRVSKVEDLARVEREAFSCEALLLDARVAGALGGTGRTFDWSILDGWTRARPMVLAGGLTPDNVAEAVARVRPAWVDTASGVESAPGIKDAAKMRAFVKAAVSVRIQ